MLAGDPVDGRLQRLPAEPAPLELMGDHQPHDAVPLGGLIPVDGVKEHKADEFVAGIDRPRLRLRIDVGLGDAQHVRRDETATAPAGLPA